MTTATFLSNNYSDNERKYEQNNNFSFAASVTQNNLTMIILQKNSTSDSYYFRLKFAVGIWLGIACVLGTLANLIAIRGAWKLCRSSKKHAVFRYHWFVLSMSIADFLFSFSVAPSQFAQYTLRAHFGREACLLFYVASHCSTVASSLSLLALNVEKFLAIYRPLYHARILTEQLALSVVAVLWMLSLIWAVVFALGPMTIINEPCLLHVKSSVYYLTFAVIFFIAPTLISAVFSVVIAWIVGRRMSNRNCAHHEFDFSHQKRDSQSAVLKNGKLENERHDSLLSTNKRMNSIISQKSLTTSQNDSTSVITASRPCGRWSSAQAIFRFPSSSFLNANSARRVRKIGFIFLTTFWSFSIVLPYRIFYMIYINEYVRRSFDRKTLFTLTLISLALMSANPVGNPFITIFTHQRFRQELRQLFLNVCNCGRGFSNNNSPIRVDARLLLSANNSSRRKFEKNYTTPGRKIEKPLLRANTA